MAIERLRRFNLLAERIRNLKIKQELTADPKKTPKTIRLRMNLRATLPYHLFGYLKTQYLYIK